jgi:uncharacterized membrane protein
MQTKNKILMQQAKASLKGKWWPAVAVSLVYMLVTLGARSIPEVGPIAQLIITGPFMLGLIIFVMNISKNEKAEISQVFDGFKNFWKSLATYLLMVLFIFLWSLLLIVPGIIAGFSYAMIFFILAENPKMKPMDILRTSKKMMRGNKWKLFCLSWRFFGWGLLCLLTAGIGFLWLIPYMNVTFAKFYEDIKKNPAPEKKKKEEKVDTVKEKFVPEELE